MFDGDGSSSSGRNVVRSSSISGEMYNLEKSARGSADSVTVTASKKRRSSLGAKMVAIVGLSQWSKSTLQLNQTGERTKLHPKMTPENGAWKSNTQKRHPQKNGVYLLENGVCLAKKKTKVVKKTCDPSYQQPLLFEESPQGKVLQVIVWGDYGRMDHKCFMGMAQIILEELDLSSAVSGWYKLFPTSSLADSSIGPLTRRLSQSSLESSTSPSCP
uniref:Regulating synaptic membrane exocytosis 3 n=1 Tax=Cyanoderma ruficeps TaxID=181631 RepID=A0A8C3QZQ9_9PASS